MNVLGSLIVTLLVLGVVFFLVWIIPFVGPKARKWTLIGMAIFTLLIMFMPAKWLCNIKLPIINNTINNFTVGFMSKTGLYGDLVTLDPSIQNKVLNLVAGMIKGCFALIIMSVAIFALALTLYLIHLIKHRKKIFLTTIGFVGMVLISGILMVSPVCAVSNLNSTINKTVARKDELFVETYSNYSEYDRVLNLLNNIKMSNGINKFLSHFVNTYSFGDLQRIINELNNVDEHLNLLKESGAAIIYTDDNFDFSQTKTGTFDFDKISQLIGNVQHSNVYNEIPLQFANNIMRAFEKQIEEDRKNISSANLSLDVNMQYTYEDFKDEYVDLMEMLKFVVNYDLVNQVQNLNIQTLLNLAKNLGLSGLDDVLKMSNTPIVKRIQSYIGVKTGVEAAIYTGIRLYDVLNDWLVEYKESSLYSTVKTFLEYRNII